MQVKFKAKEKGEQPKLFTQLPHLLECFTKHPLDKHPKDVFFLAAWSGFEPEQNESESFVLPLHNQAI